jgi:hypothetical protein
MNLVEILKSLIHRSGFATDLEKAAHLDSVESEVQDLLSLPARVTALETRMTAVEADQSARQDATPSMPVQTPVQETVQPAGSSEPVAAPEVPGE